MNNKKTKVFFDTEFTGLHQNTTLISIGLISECGKTFYAEFLDFDESQINDWLRDNVLKNMQYLWHRNNEPKQMIRYSTSDNRLENVKVFGKTDIIKSSIEEWLMQFSEIEIWSDCLSYDWVLFSQIFGHAFNIPKNVYYIPFDICTLFYAKGIDADISREEFSEMTEGSQKHNALWDAKVIRQCFFKLQGVS